MLPWRQSRSFEAILFLAALEESYCLLCALEYDLENGDVYMIQMSGYVSVPTNKEAETAGLQHQSRRAIIRQLH